MSAIEQTIEMASERGEMVLADDARAELATLNKLKEAWEIYFQAQKEKEKHKGKKAWLWIRFFTTAENMAKAALNELAR